MDVLVTRRDGSKRTKSRDGYLTTPGPTLLLCLAPVAALLTHAERGHGSVGNGHATVPESASLIGKLATAVAAPMTGRSTL